MRLEESDKHMSQDIKAEEQTIYNSENIFSYNSVLSDKEPRPVYISLRESKLATPPQEEGIFGK